jgi:hypothetical protein
MMVVNWAVLPVAAASGSMPSHQHRSIQDQEDTGDEVVRLAQAWLVPLLDQQRVLPN